MFRDELKRIGATGPFLENSMEWVEDPKGKVWKFADDFADDGEIKVVDGFVHLDLNPSRRGTSAGFELFGLVLHPSYEWAGIEERWADGLLNVSYFLHLDGPEAVARYREEVVRAPVKDGKPVGDFQHPEDPQVVLRAVKKWLAERPEMRRALPQLAFLDP